jgi:endogenous inhibitor of DNA gyrase (YacG/DUF329 family)
MTRTPADTLGRCPDCGEPVSRRRILIEYEASDGRTKAFAECPTCDRVTPPLRINGSSDA